MLLIDESTMQEITIHEMMAHAKRTGVSLSVVQKFLTLVEQDRATYAIAVLKAMSLLQELQIPVATNRLQTILRVSKLKFHGTDGVRGVVVSAQQTFSKSLLDYLEDGLLSPAFCYLLVRAFLSLASEVGQEGNRHIVVAEDGRDCTSGRALVRTVAAAARDEGYLVDYLGILPTPGVAAYSLKYNQLGVMITASHNPSQYNGIKCFVQGTKLYPDGSLGEYAISERAINLSFQAQQITFPAAPEARRSGIELLKEATLTCISEDENELLKHASITIDCANGALSLCYQDICDALDLGCDVVAASVEPGTINKECGAAELEDWFHIPLKPPFVTPLIEHMTTRCQKSQTRQFGLAVDGDGDRCMVLLLEPGAEHCAVLHGDEQLMLLARRFTEVKHLAITIESDPHTKSMLSSLFREKTLNVKGVGDRYLRYGMESIALIGAEDSGHVIFPVALEENLFLYSGNGLLTGLLVIAELQKGGFLPLNE